MQTPENWSLLEDFANALGAATACNKPPFENRLSHPNLTQNQCRPRSSIYP